MSIMPVGLAPASAGSEFAPPRIRNVDAPDEPRGTKRKREGGEFASVETAEQPRVKRIRVETDDEWVIQELFDAVAEGDIQQVQAMLAASPELLGAFWPGPESVPLLCHAAKYGRGDMISMLHTMGMPVDVRNSSGLTPLMYAAREGHVDVIRMLCQLGADPNALTEKKMDPLGAALSTRQLEACKVLIESGVDIFRQSRVSREGSNGYCIFFPVHNILRSDFTELITWLLDTGRLRPDWIVPNEAMNLIGLAANAGARSVVCLLMERGVAPYSGVATEGKASGRTAFEYAVRRNYVHVVECILKAQPPSDVQALLQIKPLSPVSADLILHANLWSNPKGPPADGLKDGVLRQRPQQSLEGLACSSFAYLPLATVWSELHRDGWSCLFAPPSEKLNAYKTSAAILGHNAFKRRWAPANAPASTAQQLQMLVEWMSDACAAHAPFSELKLTQQTEQVMNQMFHLQRASMLSAIAHFRSQFSDHVRSLPGLCMNVYISRAGEVNKPDLYRRMTEEWGLYDPVARAALRLVDEAHATLRNPSQTLSAEFSALPPVEQLTHVMVGLLDEWDKLNEITEAMRKGSSDAEVEVLSDLLLQQWRLLGEAFGVTKPRHSQFGPRKPDSAEVEPMMEVDEGPSASIEQVSLPAY